MRAGRSVSLRYPLLSVVLSVRWSGVGASGQRELPSLVETWCGEAERSVPALSEDVGDAKKLQLHERKETIDGHDCYSPQQIFFQYIRCV